MADRREMVPQVVDSLLDSLDGAASGGVDAAAIEAAQVEVATYPADQVLVVQGLPGTGRTQVGLRRAAWLLGQRSEHVRADDILMVGPDPAWVRRASDALAVPGDDAVLRLPLTALGPRVRVSREDPPEVRRLKGDRRLLRLVLRGLRNRQRVETGPIEITVQGRSVQLDGARFANRARLLGGRPHNEAHRELRLLLLDDLRSRLNRPDTRNLAALQLAGHGPSARDVDSHLAQVWPNLTPQSFLIELLSSRRHLVAAAAGSLSDDEIELISIPEHARVGTWRWSADDVPLLDAADALLNGPPATYEHVLVDEAEDLSPLQLESIRRRSRHGAITALGDLAQATGPWAHDSWDDVIDLLVRDRGSAATAELDLGYRLPGEVHEVAMRLLPEVAPTARRPTAVRRSGHEVQVVDASGTGLARGVVVTVRALLGTGPMAVIVPESASAAVAAALDDADIAWTSEVRDSTTPIVVVSPERSKGLEFETVVVVEPAEIIAEATQGARALFVALTRCTERLALVHEAALPAVLDLDVPPAEAVAVPSTDSTAGWQPVDVAGDADTADRDDGGRPVVAAPPLALAGYDDEPVVPLDTTGEGVVVALRGVRSRGEPASPLGRADPTDPAGRADVDAAEPPAEPAAETGHGDVESTAGAPLDASPDEGRVDEPAPRVAAGAFSELDRTVARAVAKALTDELARCVTPSLLPLVADEVVRLVGPTPPERPGDDDGTGRTERPG